MCREHSSLLIKIFHCGGSMFSNILRNLRSAKAPAKCFTVRFLENYFPSLAFSCLAVSFSLASSSAVLSCSSSNYFSSINSSGSTSRVSSMPSPSSLRWKLSPEPQPCWFLQPPHAWQIHWSHGQTWVSSSRCPSYTPCWHHPKPKQGSWGAIIDVVILLELHQCLCQQQQ